MRRKRLAMRFPSVPPLKTIGWKKNLAKPSQDCRVSSFCLRVLFFHPQISMKKNTLDHNSSLAVAIDHFFHLGCMPVCDLKCDSSFSASRNAPPQKKTLPASREIRFQSCCAIACQVGPQRTENCLTYVQFVSLSPPPSRSCSPTALCTSPRYGGRF